MAIARARLVDVSLTRWYPRGVERTRIAPSTHPSITWAAIPAGLITELTRPSGS
jgi:hypothetical protein